MAIKRGDVDKKKSKTSSTTTSPALNDIVNKMAGGQGILATAERQAAPEIVRLDNGTIRAYDFTLTACGIVPDDVPHDIEKWNFLRDLLFSIEGRIGLFIGDYLVGMEKIHGVTYPQLAEEIGREASTLYNYHWVCKNVDFSLRKENLSFGHYNLVAGRSPEEQEKWLDLAAIGDDSKAWSVARLRAEMKTQDDEIASERPSKFDRNLLNIRQQLTEKNWKKWSKKERRQRYELLKYMLEQMEEWGV